MRPSTLTRGARDVFIGWVLCAAALMMTESLGIKDCQAGTGPLAGPPPASALYPTDDAYVDNHNEYLNFGTSYLRVGSNPAGGEQRIYLKFDLSSLPSNGVVKKATLWLWRQNSSEFDLQTTIAAVANTTWTENTITWHNRPASGSVLDTTLIPAYFYPAVGGWFTWDVNVTSWAQTAYQGSRIMSLFGAPPSACGCLATFASKESGQGTSPRLEVEMDYPYDYGDAPDPPYPTLAAHNGAWAKVLPGFCLGSSVDGEPDGQPDPNALSDKDDDGVVFTSPLTPGQTATADVTVTTSGYPAYLSAWIDFNGDGSWSDSSERIFSGPVVAGVNKLSFTVPATAVSGTTYARFRLGTAVAGASASCEPWGPPANLGYGEVEDYKVTIGSAYTMDFGDAPDPPYPTLLAHDGARHTIVPGVFLGSRVDGELDGQPDPNALGDDRAILSYFDDEDGVVFASALVCGQTACVDVTASCAGYLSAWVDFNRDGDWSDSGEAIFTNQPVASGPNRLTFNVPAGASVGMTFARFRFSTSLIPGYTGLCPDGEVEDYQVRILAHETPKAPADRLIWSQPPVEPDPMNAPGRYYGLAQPSYGPTTNGDVSVAAGDFLNLGLMPITCIHWWGSYQGWSGSNPPSVRPSKFQIALWDNVQAGTNWPSKHPGMLWDLKDIPINNVQEQRVGVNDRMESVFQYYVDLGSNWNFYPIWAGTNWISIVAVYSSKQAQAASWQWQTRPCVADDAGVGFRVPTLSSHMVVDPTGNSLNPVQEVAGTWVKSYDMAFELGTDPAFVIAAQPFTQLRDWPHYEDQVSMATAGVTEYAQPPDLTGWGIDVDATYLMPPEDPYVDQIVADDFISTTSGTLVGITIWGSWEGDILPMSHPDTVTFNVTIRADNAKSPGSILWSQSFKKDAFTVDTIDASAEAFCDPAGGMCTVGDHTKVYKYTIRVDPNKAFVLSGTSSSPKTYWLSVQTRVVLLPGTMDIPRFGWKTSSDQKSSGARWVAADEPYSGPWNALNYPAGYPKSGKSMDMAFSLSIQGGAGNVAIQAAVADDWQYKGPPSGLALYPGLAAAVWWGSYIGYGSEFGQVPSSDIELPTRPDSFLLYVLTDVTPGHVLWECEVTDYWQTFVGVDKHPYGEPNEAVFRYSAVLPWYNLQVPSHGTFWFSVVAVYKNAGTVKYPWGWTNHAHWYAGDAVTGKPLSSSPGVFGWQPQFLKDQTGTGEDMSFMLFTEAMP